MKKGSRAAICLVVIGICLFAAAGPALASLEDVQALPDLFIDGRLLRSEDPILLIGGRTLVPVRMMMEALGASVEWEPESQTITIAGGAGTSLKFWIDSQLVYIKSETELSYYASDTAPRVINGRTYVPLRVMTDSTGLSVWWNERTRRIRIITGVDQNASSPAEWAFAPPEGSIRVDPDQEELFETHWQGQRLGLPVPKSSPVDDSYFHDAVFIGDSRVVGLMLFSGLTEAAFYAEIGVNVNSILTSRIVMQTGGAKITVPEALQRRSVGKVYFKMGLNELGWVYPALFIESYGKVIDHVRRIQPDAILYVMSILPVSQTKDREADVFTNQRIRVFNELIREMAQEKSVYYLDVFGGMIGENGFLPEDAGHDGIHLNKDYCLKWLDYLRRHTVR